MQNCVANGVKDEESDCDGSGIIRSRSATNVTCPFSPLDESGLVDGARRGEFYRVGRIVFTMVAWGARLCHAVHNT